MPGCQGLLTSSPNSSAAARQVDELAKTIGLRFKQDAVHSVLPFVKSHYQHMLQGRDPLGATGFYSYCRMATRANPLH